MGTGDRPQVGTAVNDFDNVVPLGFQPSSSAVVGKHPGQCGRGAIARIRAGLPVRIGRDHRQVVVTHRPGRLPVPVTVHVLAATPVKVSRQ